MRQRSWRGERNGMNGRDKQVLGVKLITLDVQEWEEKNMGVWDWWCSWRRPSKSGIKKINMLSLGHFSLQDLIRGIRYSRKTNFLLHSVCCNLWKSYWMRNYQNRGWKWNGNLYNINKIQYLPAGWRRYPLLMVIT